MAKFELFGARSCPYTREMREWLDWRGCDYEEYDVERDAQALSRMLALSGGQRMVPVLAEDGKAVQIGWHGNGCAIDIKAHA